MIDRTARIGLLALCGGSLLALAAAAQAQTASDTTLAPTLEANAAPAGPNDAGASEGGLADIVVTAQRRSESLQTVPIAVTAVTGDAVAAMHAVTVQGLQGTVPNVQINNFGNTPNTAVFSIRGIGVVDPDPYAGNTVSIVVDGIPQYFSTGALVDLYDIGRIEVLRGPQGTLFGANTTGGVINIVTEQPTGKFGGKAQASYGNYNRFEIAGSLDFPITDTLAGKIAVSHTQRDGWYTNIVDGKDMADRNVTLYRGYLKYEPSSDFDATLIGEYDRSRNGAPPVVNGAVPGEARYVAPGTLLPGAVLPQYANPCPVIAQRCHAPDKYFSARDANLDDRSDMNTYAGTLTMNLRNSGIGDITSITGYKDFHLREITDQNGTAQIADATDRTVKGWQFSQELRTSIDWTDNINTVLGAFYMKTHYFLSQNFLIQFAAPGFSQLSTQNQDNYSASAFAQTYVNLSDSLRAQAGIRYTYEKTKMTDGVFNFINPTGIASFTGNTALGGFTVRGKEDWNNVGWKLGLDYKIARGSLLYGYWARGFKSGGFVGRITLPSDIGPYDPEKVDTFELGIKTDLFDRRLRLNLAGFYTNYRDLQVAQIYFAPNEQGVLVNGNSIINVPKAEIKGFEAEATALPVDGLTLTGSLAYLDAKYKNFCYVDANAAAGGGASDPACPASPPGQPPSRDLSGFDLQNAPKWAATAGFTYEFGFAGGKLAAHALYTYTASKFLTAVNNTPRAQVQPTHYVNANLDWTPESERFSIGLWANNLFDNRYIQSVYDAPGVFGLVNYAPPREYGVTVKANF